MKHRVIWLLGLSSTLAACGASPQDYELFTNGNVSFSKIEGTDKYRFYASIAMRERGDKFKPNKLKFVVKYYDDNNKEVCKSHNVKVDYSINPYNKSLGSYYEHMECDENPVRAKGFVGIVPIFGEPKAFKTTTVVVKEIKPEKTYSAMSSKDQKELIATVINLTGQLCADILNVREAGYMKFIVDCKEYRHRVGSIRYRIDLNSGTVTNLG